MIDVIRREFIYLWFYVTVLFEQIAPYWIVGIVLGSIISVFFKKRIITLVFKRRTGGNSVVAIVAASLLGVASPLCMYGTVPVAAAFSKKGMPDYLLGSFMMSSIMLNPQLMIYSFALGRTMLLIRFAASVLIGILAGLLIRYFHREKAFFDFSSFKELQDRDKHPNILIRLGENLFRNLKATGGYFFIGIALTALFQRYVPTGAFVGLFGKNEGLGVLYAATLGVPVYVCGGGTIPMLMEWLHRGMSSGAVLAFMITGPATKFTNMGAVKIVLGNRRFFTYLAYTILFALVFGITTNYLIK